MPIRRLRAWTEAAAEAGVFGVPTLAIGGELFWGRVRVPMAEARAARQPPRGGTRGGEDELLSEASRYGVFRVVANGPAFGTRLTADQISDHRADAPRYEKRRKGVLLNLL